MGTVLLLPRVRSQKLTIFLLEDWVNTPLHAGQTLVTDSGTFLELEFNGIDGVKVKLSENSMLSFLSMKMVATSSKCIMAV